MSRSLKKGPYVDERLMKKVRALRRGDKTVIKTYSRASTVSPDMVGFTFGVHNGRNFIEVFITEDKVGHKLGEFALTRKFIRHGGRIAKAEETARAEAEKAKIEAAQKTTGEGKK